MNNSTHTKSDTFSVMKQGNAFKFLSNGEWRTSSSGKTMKEVTPYDNTEAYEFQSCSQQDIDDVFKAANRAQRDWAKTPLWKRAEYLRKAAVILRENKDEIATALVKEIAKNRKSAVSEVIRTADLIEYTAEEGTRMVGKLMTSDSFPGQKRDKLCLVHRVPLGVILCIPPFNYPVNLCASKVAPALITGNSVVIKTPSQGAVSALYLAAAFHLAGVPAGVVNAVTGKGSEIGDFLTTHPLVNCISLTGGGTTGMSVCKKVGMIPLQMELGGKDAAIILPDCDLDLAAKAIVSGAFSYSAQRCTAVKVVLAVEPIGDELVKKVVEGVKKLTVGHPEDNADITAVINKSSADYIESLVFDARQKGASEVCPYKREGNLLWPTVFDHVREDMKIAWEEPFGPVLPIVRVKSVEDAIEFANRSTMGLQGCVFTNDIEKAIHISDQLSTGTVQVNGQPARGPDHFPFQGFKDSGLGSQGVYFSLEAMTKVKSTVINLRQESYAMN
ncbi:hypothetical protein GpartN1_g2443.t1 [Galdieria partita]|uniref:NADP-dependent glyceraldehyde-3-phosphate dehydrogenase n=1 Tax=Galdieria partita TaxID=83374 RepID=A0A9C7PVF4_9RHOD|nr:hypothetical protein GpartN1_g2443.t1 [Galdieria partita]